jgi:hypothetical protein
LLLDALKEIEPQALTAHNAQKYEGKVLPLTKWDLSAYIFTADELKIITPETAQLADHAREFRNHIHPGRIVDTHQSCKERWVSAIDW